MYGGGVLLTLIATGAAIAGVVQSGQSGLGKIAVVVVLGVPLLWAATGPLLDEPATDPQAAIQATETVRHQDATRRAGAALDEARQRLVPSERVCHPVAPATIGKLEAKLYVSGDVHLRGVEAVQSANDPHLWLVAGEVHGKTA